MEGFLKEKLQERKEKGLLRVLRDQEDLVDFLSNDYLGLARNEEIFDRINSRVRREGFVGNGGTGSRLLSGNYAAYRKLEDSLAKLFRSESTLVFNSGYVANQGLVSAVAGRGDTILYDELSHVCLKEGAWLSKAESFSFKHNNLQDLEVKTSRATGRIFVITQSVYSMDGDKAPLAEIIRLCKKYEANLIVDEAHSTGTFGEAGSGLLCEKGLEQDVFARVYTFGKGMGVHGACIAGSKSLISYLVNFGRAFIYSTSLPPYSVISIEESFGYLADHVELQAQLKSNIDYFKSRVDSPSSTSIQPIFISGNPEVIKVADDLRKKGLNVLPIVAPTVKEGTERLRLCLHSFNTEDEISSLATNLNHENN
ncbi:MAG: 8-amino-7-oxononanoate synthase [Cytophagales bacterium]|nr:8-amino-7-oxononanoate synthase [Cytophagales bacterium]